MAGNGHLSHKLQTIDKQTMLIQLGWIRVISLLEDTRHI